VEKIYAFEGYLCALFTHGVQSLVFDHKPLSTPVFGYFLYANTQAWGRCGKSSYVQWCQESQKTHRSHCLTVLIHNWSVHQTQEWGLTVHAYLRCTVGLPCN